MRRIYHLKAEGRSQADGAFSLDTSLTEKTRYQIQVEVSATPAAGTLAVGVKTPGAAGFASVGTIDLTQAPLAVRLEAKAEAIQFTPSSFDAGKTFSVYVAVGD